MKVEKIDVADQLASILALTLVNESEKLLGGLEKWTREDIDIKQENKADRVIYTLSGVSGTKVNNPDISFMFNDDLNIEQLPELIYLTDLVYKYYVTLGLLRYTVEE